MLSSAKRLLAAFAFAASTSAAAAPCAPGSLADYLALPSCDIAGTTFSSFSLGLIPFGATPIDPAGVQVVPVVSAAMPGFAFVLNATASAGLFLDSLVHFGVGAPTGFSIVGVDASLSGAAAMGSGVVTLIEELCLDGSFAVPPLGCPTPPETLILFANEFDALASDARAFAGVSFVDVAADIGIDGGPSGSAFLQSVTLRFLNTRTAVAEPPALALASIALAIALAVTRRRRARR
jgi:hypothetical protein